MTSRQQMKPEETNAGDAVIGKPPTEDGTPVAVGRKKTPKTVLFVTVTSLSLLGVMAIVVLFARLDALTASPHITFALFLGVVATIAVGVGLMALVFYSDRSGHDETIQ